MTIPDAPLPPWVLAHAEYEGRAVHLLDGYAAAAACTCAEMRRGVPPEDRFRVGSGPPTPDSSHSPECPVRGHALALAWFGGDKDRAWAEYHRRAAALLEDSHED